MNASRDTEPSLCDPSEHFGHEVVRARRFFVQCVVIVGGNVIGHDADSSRTTSVERFDALHRFPLLRMVSGSSFLL